MRKVVILMISAIAMAFITATSASAQNSTTTTKNITNETNVTNTNTVQTEVVPQYDINYATIVFENAWVGVNGVRQPIYIKALSGKRAGKTTLKSSPTEIDQRSTASIDVKKVDTLLSSGEKTGYITFAVAIGKDDPNYYKTFKVIYPGVDKKIGIVSNDVDLKIFTDNNKKSKAVIVESNNFTEGEGKTTFFSLKNSSTSHITIDNPGVNAYVVPVGETIQLSEEDVAAISSVKDGIHVLCSNPKDQSIPPTRKTLYLAIPKNAGVITITDASFKDKANDLNVVQYVLVNTSPFAIVVSGLKMVTKGTKGTYTTTDDGLVTIDPGDSKVVSVKYGVNHIKVTCADETGEEINQTLLVAAGYKSRGQLCYLGKTTKFRLIPQ